MLWRYDNAEDVPRERAREVGGGAQFLAGAIVVATATGRSDAHNG